MIKRIAPFIVVLAFTILLNGCFEDASPIPNRLSLRMNINSVNVPIGDPQDTVVIEEVKFVLDKFQIFTPDTEDTLESQVDAIIMNYSDENLGGDEVIIEGPLGVVDITQFEAFKIFVDVLDDSDNVFDPDLRSNAGLFSLVIKGEFNGINFTHQSTIKFEKLFDFVNAVRIDENRETLLIRVVSDANDFIIDPADQTVLNPNIESDGEKIDSLLQLNLQVEASAASSIPFN